MRNKVVNVLASALLAGLAWAQDRGVITGTVLDEHGSPVVKAKALITEKGSILREKARQYTFEVHTDANKIEIKRAVEAIFKVKVENVRTQMMHGKVKRLGRSVGRRPDWKRAVVTLAPEQTIELFDQV